jgi:chemotaxis protein methyltransferase CheR
MPQSDDNQGIEIRLLLEAIHSKYGYDLRDYSPASMSRRFQTILAKSGAMNLGDLQHRLITDSSLFASILDDLTVQVSEMFRDPRFFRSFRTHVVPVLRTYPQVKIWHAGCAGGEEVYATAILLAEEDLIDRTLLYATDLSEGALDRAREGVYSEERAALFAENYAASDPKGNFDDHFSRAYGRITVKESLRKSILFFQHDLGTDYALGEMNVILCRNVLIYFAPKLRDRVTGMFSKSLTRGGFLCIGANERLSPEEREHFDPIAAGETIYRLRMES